ncbi:MAG: hypothetical protein M1814_005718 [Vezdaea aestivalis]|nr:MAG: hypothetical protein M1814_005718 [Vezdaea aestivalis]
MAAEARNQRTNARLEFIWRPMINKWDLPEELVDGRGLHNGTIFDPRIQSCQKNSLFLDRHSRGFLKETIEQFEADALDHGHIRDFFGQLFNTLTNAAKTIELQRTPRALTQTTFAQHKYDRPTTVETWTLDKPDTPPESPSNQKVTRTPGKRRFSSGESSQPRRKVTKLSSSAKRSTELKINNYDFTRETKPAADSRRIIKPNASYCSRIASLTPNQSSSTAQHDALSSRENSFKSTSTAQSRPHSVFSRVDSDPYTSANSSFSRSFQEWGDDSYHLDKSDCHETGSDTVVFSKLQNGDDSDALEAEIESVSQPLEELAIADIQPPSVFRAQSDKQLDRSKPSDLINTIKEKLASSSGFGEPMPPRHQSLPLRVRYEISRLALYCRISLSDLGKIPLDVTKSYNQLWNWIQDQQAFVDKVLPEKCTEKVWAAAESFEEVSASGEIEYCRSRDDVDFFNFRLKPMTTDKPHRLGRRFGNDRFLTVDFPSTDRLKIPKWIQSGEGFRTEIANWLHNQTFDICGRKWKVFAIVPLKRNNQKSGAAAVLQLFAVDGCDFSRTRSASSSRSNNLLNRKPQSVEDLWQWFLEPQLNNNSMACKAFDRIRIGLSRPKATVVLEANQIRHVRDKVNRSGGEVGKVMDDGCARMSRGLARQIARQLELTAWPTAFQGRIGAAKGLWIADLNEDCSRSSDNPDQDIWIEVNESQTKFKVSATQLNRDAFFRTFEVLGCARPLKSAELNVQFLPILHNQGVPRHVLRNLLEKDIEFKITELREALTGGRIFFRQWCQDTKSVVSDRLHGEAVPWLAGLPQSETERIIFMLESGFDPRSNKFLSDIAWRQCSQYCMKLQERLHINVQQSCSCYCVADPLGVLKPGEVHIGFSGSFDTPDNSFQDTLLDNREVLVARSPAHLTSDIQKVRCVFKSELAPLKDVIVFPSTGLVPLASLLSGGDYDGDRVWVCWDPELVAPFHSAPLLDAVAMEFEKDDKTIGDLLDPDATKTFLQHCFDFALRPSLLGLCTSYKESYCYLQNNLDGEAAHALSTLISNLVDARKAGVIFDDDHWQQLKASLGLPKKLNKPAYDQDSKERPKGAPKNGCVHINDYLYFDVALSKIEDLKTSFHDTFREAVVSDSDLTELFRKRDLTANSDPELREVIRNLNTQLERVFQSWRASQSHKQDGWRKTKKANEKGYEEKLAEAFEAYNGIRPMESDHTLVKLWNEDLISSTGEWKRFKASATFWRFHKRGNFPWLMAGRELGLIKAHATQDPRTVVEDIHSGMKMDRTYTAGLRAKRSKSNLRTSGDGTAT